MPFFSNSDSVIAAGDNLKAALKERFDTKRDTKVGDKIFELLETYIDAKIDYAKNDLENKINKTGEYDPHW